jgi:hypothetical protein
MPMPHVLAGVAMLAAADWTTVIRVKQVGYLSAAPKVAILCSVIRVAGHVVKCQPVNGGRALLLSHEIDLERSFAV